MPSDAPQDSASTHDAVASTSAKIENAKRIGMMFSIPRALSQSGYGELQDEL